MEGKNHHITNTGLTIQSHLINRQIQAADQHNMAKNKVKNKTDKNTQAKSSLL